jgi:hypothetical protein
MPKLSLSIPHVLTQDEAMQRLKDKFATARSEYQGQVSDLREEWRENIYSFGFKALGMAISGTIAVEQKCVNLAANLPLAATFFKGAIEERIRQEVNGLLGSESASNGNG